MTRKYLLFLLFPGLVACSQRQGKEIPSREINAKTFSVKDFNALSNMPAGQELVSLDLDYNGAIDNGFVIPSVKQTKEGVFVCTFSLKNNSSATASFYYKIYYQDESYKFDEAESESSKENPLSAENFYGSWENTDITFRQVTLPGDGAYHIVTDSIR